MVKDFAITVKIDRVIKDAVDKKVDTMKESAPSFKRADVVRMAIVKYLKEQGFLEKGKKYL